MNDYSCQLHLEAPIGAVHDAIATSAGLRGWWTADAVAATEAGGTTRLGFGSAYVVFRVDRLLRPTELDWTCVDQDDHGLPEPDEWVGTRPSFRLSEESGGTSLAFVHRGLGPQLACFGACERGWDRFLRGSLKPLVERGQGLPWTA
jgi:uncharacterized protein YndB with AHSA1/START domain